MLSASLNKTFPSLIVRFMKYMHKYNEYQLQRSNTQLHASSLFHLRPDMFMPPDVLHHVASCPDMLTASQDYIDQTPRSYLREYEEQVSHQCYIVKNTQPKHYIGRTCAIFKSKLGLNKIVCTDVDYSRYWMFFCIFPIYHTVYVLIFYK